VTDELDRRVLPLFCVGFEGLAVPDHVRGWLAAGLGGVILFARNLHDLEQVCRLTGDLRAAGARLIGVDQEGGRVVRLPAPFTVPPAAAAVGRTGDPALAQALARAVGAELRAAGFTWDLVPVLDVHTNPANPIIGDRAYGSDPAIVARIGLAVMRGFAEAGLLTTAKHFPGHGDTDLDSHLALPACRQPRSRWDAVELAPFREAVRAGVPAILVAHLQCPALDPELPSSLSPAVIGTILRGELGFGGLVVSDDLEMRAILDRYDVGEASVRFLEAGGDLLLVCRDAERQRTAIRAVAAAVQSGRLPEARLQAARERVRAAQATATAGAEKSGLETARDVVGRRAHGETVQKVMNYGKTR
jgi:beta-N-acetylhexosaminidase